MKKPTSTNDFNYAIEESYVLQADDSRLQRILDATDVRRTGARPMDRQAVRNIIKSRRCAVSLAPICATKMLRKNIVDSLGTSYTNRPINQKLEEMFHVHDGRFD